MAGRCDPRAGNQEDFSGWFVNNQRFSGANVACCINTVCTNRDTELTGRILSFTPLDSKHLTG